MKRAVLLRSPTSLYLVNCQWSIAIFSYCFSHRLLTIVHSPFEPLEGIEPLTSSLPRKCSTTELQRHSQLVVYSSWFIVVVTLQTTNPKLQTFWSGRRGSNSPPIAWKAIALPNELLPHFPPWRGRRRNKFLKNFSLHRRRR